MKKLSLGIGLIAVAMLSGCALGPQMQMALPGDSTEYNGMIVRLHAIHEGDVGQGAAKAHVDDGVLL